MKIVKIPETCQTSEKECPFLHWNGSTAHCNYLDTVLTISACHPRKVCGIRAVMSIKNIFKIIDKPNCKECLSLYGGRCNSICEAQIIRDIETLMKKGQ